MKYHVIFVALVSLLGAEGFSPGKPEELLIVSTTLGVDRRSNEITHPIFATSTLVFTSQRQTKR
jgi:hypothetical protein